MLSLKKKEQIGNFYRNGKVYTTETIKVFDHDFISYGDGVIVPHGIYDFKLNEAYVTIGVSKDTSEFWCDCLRRWWKTYGLKNYPNADCILITADGGGSNGNRAKAWKFYLQELANKTGISITVAHYPPGTSKWNKIEHKMFSFISMNWRGVPLENYETIINLISDTKTKSGLKIKAKLDKRQYKKGFKVAEEDFKKIQLEVHKKFPQWNYTIHPLA